MRRQPLEEERPAFDMFTYEVIAHINVLGTNMVAGLSRQRNGTGVIHIDHDWKGKGDVKGDDERLDPESLLDNVSDGHVFGFRGG